MESFYPSTGGKTNYYVRKIIYGKIINDTIIFEHEKNIYIKNNYSDVFTN